MLEKIALRMHCQHCLTMNWLLKKYCKHCGWDTTKTMEEHEKEFGYY